MSNIPSEVFRKILLQLPAESLFCFRCVCKEWRNIIDDPSFIRSHANGQDSSTTLLIRTSTGTPIYYLSLDSLNFAEGHQIIDVTRVKTLMKRDVPRLPVLPVASCNGLILISSIDIKKIWVVWNPLTREFKELTPPNIKMHLVASGVGYDYATDDYKVVRIDEVWGTPYPKFAYHTHIYSLKLKSWKMIKNCPFEFSLRTSGSDQGVYLNGKLHWKSGDMIIALDLRTEEYIQLPVPPVPYGTFDVHLDALGGSLVVSFFYSLTRFDMWLMKDYGAGESWIKLFSLENLDHIRAMAGIRPIAYLKSKGHVLLQRDNMFFWLDIEKNIKKKFTICDFPHNFTSQICPGSLLRLEDSCDGHVAERITAGAKRKRKMKNDRRLKYSVTVTDFWYHSDSECASDSGWLSDDGEDY